MVIMILSLLVWRRCRELMVVKLPYVPQNLQHGYWYWALFDKGPVGYFPDPPKGWKITEKLYTVPGGTPDSFKVDKEVT